MGKISPHKAPHDLVKMLDVLRRTRRPDGPPAPGRLPARGDLRAGVARVHRRARSVDAVILAGSVTGAELEAYFQAADVFVCASDHEGFCVPLAEAMGHGVPIVAYGVTAVPETVGGAGLVLPDKSPCRSPRRWAGARSTRRSAGVLAAAGRERAAGFDLAASTQRFVSLVQQAVGVLSRRRGAPAPARRRPSALSVVTRSTDRSPADGRGRGGDPRARLGRARCAGGSSPQHPGDGRGHRVGIAGVDQHAGVAHDLGQRPASLATTGSPSVMASSTGTPKPSCREVTTRTSARPRRHERRVAHVAGEGDGVVRPISAT